jgi:hypothetical protein
VFAHLWGKCDAAVEGDHCGGHLEPLITFYLGPACLPRR